MAAYRNKTVHTIMTPDNKAAPSSPAAQGGIAAKEEIASSEGMPFSGWTPFVAGALSGLLLRLMFSGSPGSALSAMAAGFVWLAPFAVGAITVYAAERQKRRSFAYYLFAPTLATFVFVLGSLVILIEGLICAIVILPMFSLLGMFGGLVMGLVCRLTNWPKQAVYGIAALPLLVAMALPQTSVRLFPVRADADLRQQRHPQFGHARHQPRDLGASATRPRPRAPRTPVRRAPA
jgi:hypothetical protein